MAKERVTMPLGHFPAQIIADLFPNECQIIGTVTIIWNQFERELCEVFIRISEAPRQKAETIFYSTGTHKGRRDLIRNLAVESIPDKKRRKWVLSYLDYVKKAADIRNVLTHSEYYTDMEEFEHNYLVQRTPGGKSVEITRHKIFNQANECLAAIENARFMMGCAIAAIESRTGLATWLCSYRSSLRQRFASQQPRNRQTGSQSAHQTPSSKQPPQPESSGE